MAGIDFILIIRIVIGIAFVGILGAMVYVGLRREGDASDALEDRPARPVVVAARRHVNFNRRRQFPAKRQHHHRDCGKNAPLPSPPGSGCV